MCMGFECRKNSAAHVGCAVRPRGGAPSGRYQPLAGRGVGINRWRAAGQPAGSRRPCVGWAALSRWAAAGRVAGINRWRAAGWVSTGGGPRGSRRGPPSLRWVDGALAMGGGGPRDGRGPPSLRWVGGALAMGGKAAGRWRAGAVRLVRRVAGINWWRDAGQPAGSRCPCVGWAALSRWAARRRAAGAVRAGSRVAGINRWRAAGQPAGAAVPALGGRRSRDGR